MRGDSRCRFLLGQGRRRLLDPGGPADDEGRPGMGWGAPSPGPRPIACPVQLEHPEQAPLHLQILYLAGVLALNPVAQAVLAVAAEMDLPGWYLAAGGVSQTVWNVRHGFDPAQGIKDYDLVYYDPEADRDAGRAIEGQVQARLSNFSVDLDVKNEAFVHLWYGQRFGRPIEPYLSTEHAISTWPTTASSVGVRPSPDGLTVCAPYGLSDLLGMVARPNKAIVSRDVYEEKTRRWAARWPRLTVIPW